jgi:tRNA uridine 5-carboxymethylaminomethyl modification enzyme
VQRTRLAPTEAVNARLRELGTAPLAEPATIWALLHRPGLSWRELCLLQGETPAHSDDVVFQVEVQARYEGYISRAVVEAARFREQEGRRIPDELDYATIPGLSMEVRQKLAALRPASLGQAARVAGVTPAAVSLLAVFLKGKGQRSI